MQIFHTHNQKFNMKTFLHYLDEKNLTVRQGNQLWHLHKALMEHSEGDVISHMATEYQANGRVKTLAEGMVLAGAVVTAYRSTESAERVPQRARVRLDKERTIREAQAKRLHPTTAEA